MEALSGLLAGGVMGWFLWIVLALVIVFALGSLVLWVWMIIDCVTRKFPQANNELRLVWILVFIFAGAIGSLIYLFVVKIPQDRQARARADINS